MDITTKTIDELKSLAYDQILLLNQAQQNINILNAEIAKRQQVDSTVKMDKEPEGDKK